MQTPNPYSTDGQVLLSTSVQVAVDGENVPPVLEDLRNPSYAPMLIDEIRFRVATTGGGDISLLGQAMQALVDLRLGPHKLMNEFVPVNLIGRRNLIMGDALSWHPRKPIYVPAGMILAPTFRVKRVTGSAQAIVFSILYLARTLPVDHPTPESIELPWISLYEPEPYPETGTQEQESKPTDLVNGADSPLHVEYLLTNAGLLQSNSNTGFEVGYDQTTVRVFDSKQHPIVRDEVPLNSLFSPLDGAWDMRLTLPPADFITMALRTTYALHDGSYDRLLFTMVGHREVKLR